MGGRGGSSGQTEPFAKFKNATNTVLSALERYEAGNEDWQTATWGLLQHNTWAVGIMDKETRAAAEKFGLDIANAGEHIQVVDVDIFHANRLAHRKNGMAIPKEYYLKMPEILANPKAIYYDKKNKSLLYEFDTRITDPNKGKMSGVFVVKVGHYKVAGGTKRMHKTLSKVRTALLTPASALGNENMYVKIK